MSTVSLFCSVLEFGPVPTSPVSRVRSSESTQNENAAVVCVCDRDEKRVETPRARGAPSGRGVSCHHSKSGAAARRPACAGAASASPHGQAFHVLQHQAAEFEASSLGQNTRMLFA